MKSYNITFTLNGKKHVGIGIRANSPIEAIQAHHDWMKMFMPDFHSTVESVEEVPVKN